MQSNKSEQKIKLLSNIWHLRRCKISMISKVDKICTRGDERNVNKVFVSIAGKEGFV